MDPSATCYTIIHDDLLEVPSSQDLRDALQKGSDEVKLETLRRIIVATLNGQSHVSCCARARPAVVNLSTVHPLDCARARSPRATPLTLPVLASYAHHPVCAALAQQADQEAPPLLLGVSVDAQ
jgi:hypothetical protein